ncbi:MAG: hypothetical protein KF708_02400 [Pirellulales bacterium]|nr:hypothetical protein [Pirellulales bacterium]
MRIKLVIGTLIVVLLSGGTWAWWSSGPDPQLAKAEALSKKIFEQTTGPPDISKPEVREQFKQLREEVDAMPESTRREFMDHRREEMQGRMQEQFERYFAMTPEEKTKELDRVIDQMDNMRKTFEKERAEREKRGETSNGLGGRGFGPPGGPPGGPPRDPAARNEFRKKMLDSTTPEFRAQATEFMRDMSARMKERGKQLPPFPGGGGPPF